MDVNRLNNAGSFRTNLELTGKKIYTDEEIKDFRMDEAIANHPLYRKPTNMRSKLAYQQILKNLKPTPKYLLPGQIVCFEYLEPKYKDQLEYYDRTPLVLFCGITRLPDGNIREIGFNIHYYPPYARGLMLNIIWNVFRDHFVKNFNEDQHRPYTFISYKRLKTLLRRNIKIAFGLKMYIPALRANSYVIPTRLLPTAYYTEGHFSKATLAQIQSFWRRFRK